MKTKKQKIQEIKQLASDPDEPILTAEEIEFLMHHGVTIDQILEQPLILRERTVYEAKILSEGAMIDTKILTKALYINGVSANYHGPEQIQINDLLFTLSNGVAESIIIKFRYKNAKDFLRLLQQDRLLNVRPEQFERILDDYFYFIKQLNIKQL